MSICSHAEPPGLAIPPFPAGAREAAEAIALMPDRAITTRQASVAATLVTFTEVATYDMTLPALFGRPVRRTDETPQRATPPLNVVLRAVERIVDELFVAVTGGASLTAARNSL
jgi:hypothetical protein